MRLAIVGCGLVGRKRARTLGHEHQLIAAVDTDLERAQSLAASFSGAVVTTDWREVVFRSDVGAWPPYRWPP
jgi:predicted dehydrogenase